MLQIFYYVGIKQLYFFRCRNHGYGDCTAEPFQTDQFPFGKNIQRGLVGYFMQAQAGLERELGKVTIAQVLGDVLAEAKKV